MTKKSNQDIERHYFDMFRHHYSLPTGKLIYGDKPDIIISGEKEIGIEITNFFHDAGNLPESEQVQRKVREQAISKAQELYLAQGGKRFEISFGFKKSLPIKNKWALAKKISDFAKALDGVGSGQIGKAMFAHIPELSFVYLNAEEYENACWKVTQCHAGQIMQREKLLEIVRLKEAKSKAYKACHVYWLIVVVDFMDSAQDQEIQVDDFKKIDSLAFEKVIVYKTNFGHVFEAK